MWRILASGLGLLAGLCFYRESGGHFEAGMSILLLSASAVDFDDDLDPWSVDDGSFVVFLRNNLLILVFVISLVLEIVICSSEVNLRYRRFGRCAVPIVKRRWPKLSVGVRILQSSVSVSFTATNTRGFALVVALGFVYFESQPFSLLFTAFLGLGLICYPLSLELSGLRFSVRSPWQSGK